MAKDNWLKVFNMEDGNKVIVTNEQDDVSEDLTEYKLSVRTDFDSCKAEVSITFKNEQTRDEGLEGYSQKEADAFYNAIQKFIGDE